MERAPPAPSSAVMTADAGASSCGCMSDTEARTDSSRRLADAREGSPSAMSSSSYISDCNISSITSSRVRMPSGLQLSGGAALVSPIRCCLMCRCSCCGCSDTRARWLSPRWKRVSTSSSLWFAPTTSGLLSGTELRGTLLLGLMLMSFFTSRYPAMSVRSSPRNTGRREWPTLSMAATVSPSSELSADSMSTLSSGMNTSRMVFLASASTPVMTFTSSADSGCSSERDCTFPSSESRSG
mmetsp:Transcript_1666/g.2330  ORF Transcript_1666/g.2330 Transcript_1666/m.2330 type:complete len:240 (+) Transcript_1666:1079-1798(+)